jgi:hypothetical protein
MSRMYHFTGMLKEGLAGRSERDLALGAVEQLDVQFLFQSAHRRRQRRLHDMYPLGRLGEVHLGGHRDEVFQMPQLHPGILSRITIITIVFLRWTRSRIRCCLDTVSR